MTTRVALASTEYLRVAITPSPAEDVTTKDVEIAIPPAGEPPTDWIAASWETGGPPYIASILIGPDLDADATPTVGRYDVWVRITDDVEIPAFLADRLVIFDEQLTFASVSVLADTLQTDIDPEDARANQALQAATALIRAYTRQQISLVEDDEVTLETAWATNSIILPEVPVIEVSDITFIDWDNTETTVDTTDYYVDRNGIIRSLTTWPSTFNTWAWSWWSARVRITYTHGYTAIPDPIEQACAQIAARLYRSATANTTISQGPASVTSETIGGYSYRTEYDTSTTTSTMTVDNSGLTTQEQMLLERYVHRWDQP